MKNYLLLPSIAICIASSFNVYSSDHLISDISIYDNYSYEIVEGVFKGDEVYTDRNYHIQSETDFLLNPNLIQIKLPNEAKFESSMDFLSFTAETDIQLIVAHDSRYEIRPPFIGTYKYTNESIQVGNETHSFFLEIFKKKFNKGEVVTLGGNTLANNTENLSMYAVFVIPQGFNASDSELSSELTDTLELSGQVFIKQNQVFFRDTATKVHFKLVGDYSKELLSFAAISGAYDLFISIDKDTSFMTRNITGVGVVPINKVQLKAVVGPLIGEEQALFVEQYQTTEDRGDKAFSGKLNSIQGNSWVDIGHDSWYESSAQRPKFDISNEINFDEYHGCIVSIRSRDDKKIAPTIILGPKIGVFWIKPLSCDGDPADDRLNDESSFSVRPKIDWLDCAFKRVNYNWLCKLKDEQVLTKKFPIFDNLTNQSFQIAEVLSDISGNSSFGIKLVPQLKFKLKWNDNRICSDTDLLRYPMEVLVNNEVAGKVYPGTERYALDLVNKNGKPLFQISNDNGMITYSINYSLKPSEDIDIDKTQYLSGSNMLEKLDSECKIEMTEMRLGFDSVAINQDFRNLESSALWLREILPTISVENVAVQQLISSYLKTMQTIRWAMIITGEINPYLFSDRLFTDLK